MLTVALTGGIATGKTYVLQRFAALGVPTIDADRLAREAVRRDAPAWRAVVQRFGASVLTADGDVDRQKLAAIVFQDAGARRDLEAIVHPEVYQAIARWRGELAAAGQTPMAIADIPLLYETGHEGDFDAVVVTACAPAEQRRRLAARDGLTDAEARLRLAAQVPIGQKVARADWVIWTDLSDEETDRQVEQAHQALACRAAPPR